MASTGRVVGCAAVALGWRILQDYHARLAVMLGPLLGGTERNAGE